MAAQQLREKIKQQEQEMRVLSQTNTDRLEESTRIYQDIIRKKDNEIDQLYQELNDLKRYAAHFEKKFKQATDLEEEANRKVLTLLNEIQVLTSENHQLLKERESVSYATSQAFSRPMVTEVSQIEGPGLTPYGDDFANTSEAVGMRMYRTSEYKM